MRIHTITGPPCAGKSTFAHTNADPTTDVIVDLDRIAHALGAADHMPVGGRHLATTAAAHRLRQSAIKWAREQIRRHGTVWLIDTDGTHPHPHATTHIDPGEPTCHARADADQRPAGTHEAITDWYQRHAHDRRW